MNLLNIEKVSEVILDNKKHIIVRLDGHHFSKHGFTKPFDNDFEKAMIKTAKDVFKRFGAYTAFTQSDEITLFIPSLWNEDDKKEWVHIFGGRVQKIVSLTAAFATMCFNGHYPGINAYFDSRAYSCPDNSYVIESFSSRVNSCDTNYKTMYVRAHCSHKEVQGLPTEDMLKLAYEKTGSIYSEHKHSCGTFIKNSLYTKESIHGEVSRRKIITFSSDYNYKSILLSKLIENGIHYYGGT